MRTFVFHSKCDSSTIILSAPTYNEAWEELQDTAKYPSVYRVEDKEGEDE